MFIDFKGGRDWRRRGNSRGLVSPPDGYTNRRGEVIHCPLWGKTAFPWVSAPTGIRSGGGPLTLSIVSPCQDQPVVGPLKSESPLNPGESSKLRK